MAERNEDLRRPTRRSKRFFGAGLFALGLVCLWSVCLPGQNLSHSEIIKKSRESCVRILVQHESKWMSAGSGFFIDPNHIVTCCHVISEECSWDPNGFNSKDRSVDPNKLNLKWRAYPRIAVVVAGGKPGLVECISPPTPADPFPAIDDFAILRLKTKPIKGYVSVPFCHDTASLVVGDDVYFSGFPLGAPAMLTHKGMLSGLAQNPDRLCIQAPVNKGNSGGALLNTCGEVIGIISNREGGITQELSRVRDRIVEVDEKKIGSIKTFGINPLSVNKDIIDILDRYISTGIGYARNISYTREYISRHGLMKSESSVK